MWEVVEAYEGKTTVLETTDDEGDALRVGEWHRDQWADQRAAKMNVWVRRQNITRRK